jgi:DNA-binding XRE family transcriptional regulator
MVKPDYDATLTGRKVEEILLDRLTDLFAHLQTRQGDLFDEDTDWIEYLLSWETDSYNELIEFKKKLMYAFKLRLTEVFLASKKIDNVLGQKRYKKYHQALLEWQMRRDYLRKIIEIFFKRQILQYRKTTYAKITGVDIRGIPIRPDNALEDGEGSKDNPSEHPFAQ